MSLSIEPGPEPVASIVVFMDPGPDADDVKTILILGRLHDKMEINVKGFVCSGGKIPRKRALLAKLVLNKIGVNIPVFWGSKTQQEPDAVFDGRFRQGYKAHAAYELDLEGFAWNAASDTDATTEDAENYDVHSWEKTAWRDMFKKSGSSGDLIVQIQGPFTDAAKCLEDVFQNKELQNPAVISCQGGAVLKDGDLDVVEDDIAIIVKDGKITKGKLDISFNNTLDVTSCQMVVDLAVKNYVPLHMFHKSYVPRIDAGIAGEFATAYPGSDIMRYLATAQRTGLVLLWDAVKAGKLMNPQWYFENFCGDKPLPKNFMEIDINDYKNEVVTPYDVCALFTVLPYTLSLGVNLKHTLKSLAPDRLHAHDKVVIWKKSHEGIADKTHNVTDVTEEEKDAAKEKIETEIEKVLRATFAEVVQMEANTNNF